MQKLLQGFTSCKHQQGQSLSGSAGTWLGLAGVGQGQLGGLSLAFSAVVRPQVLEEGLLWEPHSEPALKAPLEPGAGHSPRQLSRTGIQDPGISVWTQGMALEVWGSQLCLRAPWCSQNSHLGSINLLCAGPKIPPSGDHRNPHAHSFSGTDTFHQKQKPVGPV